MCRGSIHPHEWGERASLYRKNRAQTPRGRNSQWGGGSSGWENGGRSFGFLGEEASTSHDVSHLVLEAFTSTNHFIQVAIHALHERMCPPLMEVSWSSSFDDWRRSYIIINVPDNILNNHDTSETSPRQYAFDLGIGFSPIFPFIWPSESFWRENQN